MKKKLLKALGLLLVIYSLVFILFVPLLRSLNFGLDLKGGFEVLYNIQKTDKTKVSSEDVKSTYNTLTSRIDKLGVSEPEIVIENFNNIRVKLANVKDIDAAREALSMVANITFRDTNNNLLMGKDVVRNAKFTQDDKGNPAISLSIKNKDKFLEVTTNVSKMKENVIVIWRDFVDGENYYLSEKDTCGKSNSNCLSNATVSQGFSSDVIITGNFTKEDAETLATAINSGFTNTRLEEISSQTVSAAFGENTLNKTLIAGIISLILVIIFMTLLYRTLGFISGMTLFMYTFFVIGTFWLIGGVLTLPGIAALILGIGMAVDSSIIIFERIKEELVKGRSLATAVNNGMTMSFSTIFDANFTTMIVAITLFIFGESSVKGFATMLIITILVTMFIMLYFLKKIIKILVATNIFDNKEKLFIGKYEKDTKIDFIKYTKRCLLFTSLIVVTGIITLASFKLNLGIDFRGGSNVTVIGKNKITVKAIGFDIKTLGYDLVETEQINNKSVYIKITNILDKKDIKTINEHFSKKYSAKTEIGVVSNMVQKVLVKNALFAIILAALAMVIYISLRYKFTYAAASVLALVHDVFIIVAVFSIVRFEISAIFIAAILAILGYSINNTIVIFDRVRENMKTVKNKFKISDEERKSMINLSINQTWKRALLTSLTTLIPITCLIFMGPREIVNFNYALMIGILAGTYSSVFLAGQLWYLLEKNKKNDLSNKKAKRVSKEPEEMKVKGINY